MTNQEAIKILGQYDVSALHFYTTEGEEIPFAEWSDAIEMAISALRAQDLQSTCNQLATDCVSRQAAIDAVISLCDDCDSGYCGSCRVNDFVGEKNARNVLEDLPSAQKKGYTKADYIMALHKEYGCGLARAEEAHQKALEYLRNTSIIKG